MKLIRACVVTLVVALSGLAGCATVGGAMVGGAAGHKYGGDATSTVGGAVIGGMIGHQISK
jgi:osmotically inducible lipoprotein OsmB